MDTARIAFLHDLYRDMLETDILPFWLRHSVDAKHGGYHTCLDRQGDVYDSDKSVWFQGRQLWMFSRLHNELLPSAELLSAAESGFRFLSNFCFDHDGRMFYLVTDDGLPLRKRRYFFSESFAAIACAEYFRATSDDQARDLALAAYDTMLGVYTGRIPSEPKIFPSTRRLFSLAAPMIVLSTTQEIRRVFPDHPAVGIAADCVDAIRNRNWQPDYDMLVESVGPGGTRYDIPACRTVNPGHAIEAGWFLLHESMEKQDASLRSFALHAIDRALEIGWDEEFGGLFSFVDAEGRQPERLEWDMKMWWPHTEALYATLLAWTLTGEDKYAAWHERVREYAFNHFPDPLHGEWFGYLHRDGSVSSTIKGSHWKGMFHVPRALLFCVQLLAAQRDRTSSVVG